MAEYHFPIPGGVDEDKIVMFVRRHWASFLGPFLLSATMIIVPAIIVVLIFIYRPDLTQGLAANFLTILLSIYYLVAITVAFVSWMSFYYDIYVICYDEIIDIAQQGFFGRKISQQSILRVQDVNASIQGVLPTLFAYGDVLVETAGEQSQNYIIKAVPNPQEIAAKVMELHNKIVEKEAREGEMLSGEGSLKVNNQYIREQRSNPIQPGRVESQPQTEYQQLLEKERQSSISPPVQPPQPIATPPSPSPTISTPRSIPAEPPTQEPPTSQPPVQSPPPAPPSQPPASQEQPKQDGEIPRDDLDQGGEIDIK